MEDRLRRAKNDKNAKQYARKIEKHRINKFYRVTYNDTQAIRENEETSYSKTPMIRRGMSNSITILMGRYKIMHTKMPIKANILDQERKNINNERKEKGLSQITWEPNIYKGLMDKEGNCIVCGESYSDETVHYFYKCTSIKEIVTAHIVTLEDRFRNKTDKEKEYTFPRLITNIC